jgi:hypothetical protein
VTGLVFCAAPLVPLRVLTGSPLLPGPVILALAALGPLGAGAAVAFLSHAGLTAAVLIALTAIGLGPLEHREVALDLIRRKPFDGQERCWLDTGCEPADLADQLQRLRAAGALCALGVVDQVGGFDSARMGHCGAKQCGVRGRAIPAEQPVFLRFFDGPPHADQAVGVEPVNRVG